MQSIIQFIGVMGISVSIITSIAFAVRGYEYFYNQNTNVFLKTIYMMSWTYMSFVLGFVTTVSLPLVMMFVAFNMDKLNIIIKDMPSNIIMDHQHNFEGVHATEEDETDEHDIEETQEATETDTGNTSSNETNDHSEQVNDETEQQNVGSVSNEQTVSEQTPSIDVSLTQIETVSDKTDKTDKTDEIKQELQNILETISKSGSSNDTQ